MKRIGVDSSISFKQKFGTLTRAIFIRRVKAPKISTKDVS